jgi:hypothetical protein
LSAIRAPCLAGRQVFLLVVGCFSGVFCHIK